MDRVTVIWSVMAGASGMLALMHLLVWVRNRRAWEHLFFPLTVMGVLGHATCELVSMKTQSPQTFGDCVRSAHLVYIFGAVGMVGFVHFHFGTGRRWLLWSALGMRVAAIVANFTTGHSLHVAEVRSLKTITFLGEPVSVLGEWEPNGWMVLGQLASLLVLVYIADASWRLWRKGGREPRRRALVLGGSLMFFVIAVTAQAGLVAAGAVEMPFLVSLPFLGVVLVMGWELSRDLLRSITLSQELDLSERRLAQAAGAAQLALWEWDISTDRIWVSSEGRMLYGVEPGPEITFKRFAATLHPEDRPKVARAVDAALAGTEPFSADYRVVLPGGGTRWIAAGGRVERDGQGRAKLLRGVSLDVTERRLAEDRFRRVIEAAPNAMVMIDAAGRIALVNAQAEAVFGYHRDELLGQPLETLIPERFRGHHPDLRESYHAHPTARSMGAGRELHGRRKDGSEVPVEIGLNPIETPDGEFVLASIIDISGRKRDEQEAALQRQELAHLSRISILGELAGALAHELNQPLAAILGNSQVGSRILRSPEPDLPQIAAILDDVAEDAKRAGGIIHGMRAMFRKESVTEAQPIDANETVQQVLALLHSEIVRRRVKVELDLSADLPAAAASRVEIQQVLINLVMNGLDAMKSDGGQLWISTRGNDGQIELRVRDRGPGISPEMMGRLFEPFVSTKHGGLGLGLAISRGIAERFRGKLLAENHSGGGAEFCLVLPAISS